MWIRGTVFLVSRVYLCTRSYQVLAHDAGIISQVQLLTRVSFILFHKAGVTRELYHFIVSHLQTSLTCSDLRVLWNQMISYYHFTSNVNDEFPILDLKDTTKTIRSCFILEYFARKSLYDCRMSQLTSDSWLSSDHTFKVAANIGFFWNNRWVKVYDSLFIVLNEICMVLTWLLTKGTKFENVENLLNNSQKRFLTKGKKLELYITDKSCS